MIDRFGRTISYLRVSVTDRCNLRCLYCMPAEGVTLLAHEDILSFEEIAAVTRCAIDMGVTKVRLTGGEPLVRHDIITLVEMVAGLDGITDLSMTTNGVLLGRYAEDLARAGIDRVNVSLDTTDPAHYAEITRGGDVGTVLAGIDAAARAGLTPVKLNCVVGPCNGDVELVREYGRENGYDVRAIRLMDFEAGHFSVVEGGSGGDCPRCNRLRLSCDGHIRPCLFSDISFNVRELGPAEAIRRAVDAKPEAGGPCSHNWMHGIGG